MRLVFIGAGIEVLKTAQMLIKKKHEVIIIEKDEDKIAEFEEDLDCGIIKGDGGNPNVLKETNPESVDYLLVLTDSDKDNVIAGLVGKSLKFQDVLVSIKNPSYEKICYELGLENVIIPSQTIAQSLVNVIEKGAGSCLDECIKERARLVKVLIEQTQPITELKLPKDARPICFYRGEQFFFTDEKSQLKEGDELILLTTEEEAHAINNGKKAGH